MTTFTVCARLVDASGSDEKLLRNTLMHFIHDRPLRIAIDSNKKALACYHEIAVRKEFVAEWLKYLTYRKEVFEKVDVVGDSSGVELFWLIAKKTIKPRQLLCYSKQDYSSLFEEEADVELIDCVEAEGVLVEACSLRLQTVVSTQGDNSPAIVGNSNSIKR